ncbi:hypothetical protein [Pseudomonas syringae]|uniref:hypothetical protein n=1 Tax=Pseudomonas syringae TaxID=317 RepID=UPI001F506274|nr:hypothetical protein [Pseudomonas syringae]
MSNEFKLVPRTATLEMKAAGQAELERQDIPPAEMQKLWFAMSNAAPQPQKEPVVWGAPKTVRQLIGQLETLDPELETVALYRLPDGLGKLSGKVKQGHISTSYERMEGIWLGPYKGNGRKVLAFWTKLDPREMPDGEPFPQPPALGGAPEVFGLIYRVNGEVVLEPVGDPHIKDGMPVYSAECLAPLQAEIERRDSKLETMRRKNNELNDDVAKLKARCDELEGLLRECRPALDQAAGGVFKEHRVIRDKVKAAMSKAAGSEQV